MLDVGYFHDTKIAALAWRRQLGHIYILMEAKQQDREGVFGSKAVLRVAAGIFRDGIPEWFQSGLLHDSTALCDRCKVAFPDLDDGNVVVHNWSKYQVSRTTSWRIDKVLDETPGETSVKQPGNTSELERKPSHARASRGSPFLVPNSETSGGPGGLDPDEASVFGYIAKQGAFIRPESGLGIRLVKLMERRSPMVVMAKAIALSATGKFSDRQWVFGLEQALETIPDAKAVEREQDAAKRAARRDQGVWARRIEAYRNTGHWEAEWGDPPGAAA